jgi:subtilisin family serine protease
MWGEPNKTFWTRVQVYNSLSALVAESAIYYTSNMPSYFDTLMIVGTDTIFFNLTTDASYPTNQRPHMRLRVRNTGNSTRVILNSGAIDGVVHYWNIIELLTGVGNWGVPFTSFGSSGVSGDSFYTIAEPTCASSCVSVGAYSARYLSQFGTLLGGAVASFTSYGPLINEQQKPDIAAPGVNVSSSISFYTDASYNSIDDVTFNGTTYDFARFSGTSMSSPCVAGIVALMLDANPLLSADQVKAILMSTARTDQFTGAILAPGDSRWGMGKVDAFAAVVESLNTIGLSVINSSSQEDLVYPNPASHTLVLSSSIQNRTAKLFDMNGRILPVRIAGNSLDVSNLESGLYVLHMEVNGVLKQARIVVTH